MIYADQGLLSAVYPCERCHAFGYDLIILERQPHLLLSLFDRLAGQRFQFFRRRIICTLCSDEVFRKRYDSDWISIT